MIRKQLIIVVISVAVIILLSRLPKTVVNTNESLEGSVSSEKVELSPSFHSKKLSIEDSILIGDLRTLVQSTSTTKSYQKIVSAFSERSYFDSAAYYAQLCFEKTTDLQCLKEAADNYYEAFSLSLNADHKKLLSKKAKTCLEQYLKEVPDDLDLKVKLGMVLTSSSNPMEGILKIREVLTVDPNNKSALLNLGLLSIQSGQYLKAIERFKKLVSLDSKNAMYHLYLGVAFLESGQKEKAKAELNLVKDYTNDEKIRNFASQYLNEL